MNISRQVARLIDRVPGSVAQSFRSDRSITRLARPLMNLVVPSDFTMVLVRSGAGTGLRLLIDPRREKYYWSGTLERPVQDALSRLLRPGMTFWDVGAHIGFFSLIASRLVGDEGHVHAFEPMRENRERLLTSIQANRAANIRVHDHAVADSNGARVLYANRSTTMWSLEPRPEAAQSYSVGYQTLDDIAKSIGAPDVIKIDVEGVEVDVLRGGGALLSEVRPVLIVEFSDAERRAAGERLLNWYSAERLSDNHWLLR